jgi:hypothetical protein
VDGPIYVDDGKGYEVLGGCAFQHVEFWYDKTHCTLNRTIGDDTYNLIVDKGCDNAAENLKYKKGQDWLVNGYEVCDGEVILHKSKWTVCKQCKDDIEYYQVNLLPVG